VTILQVMDRNAFLSDEQKQKTRRGTTKAVRK
jgi:hypothetical protein